jgi:hypothetical protein
MLIKRKTCKRQYVRVEETLIVSKISNLITKKKGSSYRCCATSLRVRGAGVTRLLSGVGRSLVNYVKDKNSNIFLYSY